MSDSNGIERLLAELPQDDADHLDPERLCTLVESDERDDPEGYRHLAGCDRCRGEWTALRRSLLELPPREELAAEVPWELERAVSRRSPRPPAVPRKPFRRLWAAAAAVAVVALLAVAVPVFRRDDPGPLRSHETGDLLRPLEPAGAVPFSGSLTFRWGADPEAGSYELVVSRAEDGAIVLRRTLREPEVTLPEAELENLERGVELRWLVRANRGTGDRVTGPVGSFALTDD